MPKKLVSLFADDTMFHSNDKNPRRAIIQLQHQIAAKWFEKWRLRANTQKIVAILFNRCKHETPMKISLASQEIPWSKSAKNIGFLFDKKNSPKNHTKTNHLKSLKTQSFLIPNSQ